ncbi:MAG: hypothetical protein ACPG7F_00290 [Aggregatilineales bacterium]
MAIFVLVLIWVMVSLLIAIPVGKFLAGRQSTNRTSRNLNTKTPA